MKFGEQVDCGPQESWLNFGSGPECILDIMDIVRLAASEKHLMIHDETAFPVAPLLSLSFSSCNTFATQLISRWLFNVDRCRLNFHA